MASSGACWGIEVGANAIKAVKLEIGSSGTANVLDFAVVPHKKVLSTPGIDQNDALRVGLGEFANQVELAGAAVAISIPGHSSFSRFAKLPPVEPKNVPDIVKFEAVQQIPFPIDEVEWDYQTFMDPNSPDVEVGIFAVTRERIMERLTQYQDVGLVPDYITIAPVANYNALAYDLQFTEKTEGTIILDIGTTSTDLVIANAGGVWIRTFPIGGHHFTEALVNAFQLSYPKAEKLKREAESSKHARHIFQAMRPIFGDLAQDVQRSIGYYQGLHKDAKLTRLVGLGSTFRLPGLRKYLKQQLGLDVYRLEQFRQVTMDGPRAGEFQSHTLNLATAVGLALQGVGSSTLNVNLMPVQVIRDAMWKRKVKWFGVAAGIGAAATGAMFVRPFLDSASVEASPRPAVISEVIERAEKLKREAADVTSATDPTFEVANILSMLDESHKKFVPQMLDDLGQMLKAADEERTKRPGYDASKVRGPVYTVHSFKPAMLAITPDPNAEGEPDYGKSLPTLRVTLKVSTTQPDALRFTSDTLDKWLRTNKTRAGVPYEISLRQGDTAFFRRTREEVISADPLAVKPETASGGSGGDSIPTTPAPRGRGRGGRTPGTPTPSSSGNEFEPIDPLKLGNVTVTGMSANSPQALKATAERQTALLTERAPLPEMPGAEPGSRVSHFDIVYELKILEKKPAEGAEGAGEPGGGS